jgi:hypothetical protein
MFISQHVSPCIFIMKKGKKARSIFVFMMIVWLDIVSQAVQQTVDPDYLVDRYY